MRQALLYIGRQAIPLLLYLLFTIYSIMTLTALITPFLENTELDLSSLRRLLEIQFNSKMDGVVILGTTAETATLSDHEKDIIVQEAISTREKLGEPAKNKKIYVGVGSNSTRQVLERIESLNQTGVDGYLIVTPYYNKPPQNGLIEHFLACDKASQKPIILYNVPGRTGVNLLPESVIEIVQNSTNVKYIKESTGDLNQVSDLAYLISSHNLQERFAVLSGDDWATVPILALGGVGLVSVLSNIYPDKTADLVNLTIQKDDQALALNLELLPTMRACFKQTNPISVKKMLFEAGLITAASVRLPLIGG